MGLNKPMTKKLYEQQLFWPVFALAVLLLYNFLFIKDFFALEIIDGHLYGSLIDILNRATPLMFMSIGMTLVIAGGIGAGNIGFNMKTLGTEGRMFLAGTSVYSHPDGVTSGVKAIILAHRAYREKGLTETKDLIKFGKSLGKEGKSLVNALKGEK